MAGLMQEHQSEQRCCTEAPTAFQVFVDPPSITSLVPGSFEDRAPCSSLRSTISEQDWKGARVEFEEPPGASALAALQSLPFGFRALGTEAGPAGAAAPRCCASIAWASQLTSSHSPFQANSVLLAGAPSSETLSVGLQVDSLKDQERVLILH